MQQIEFDLLLNFNQKKIDPFYGKKSTLFMADRNRLNTARQEKGLLRPETYPNLMLPQDDFSRF